MDSHKLSNDKLIMFSAEYETALNNPEELLGTGSAIGTVVEEMRLVLSLISFLHVVKWKHGNGLSEKAALHQKLLD